jgi:outer membrane immunogenic protein
MCAPRKFLPTSVAAVACFVAPAFAADVPVKAPVIKAATPAYDWTRWYSGVNVGFGFSQSGANDGDIQTDTDISSTRLTAGLQVGYNWHLAPLWVAGIEGDIGHLGVKGSVEGIDSGVFGVTADTYGTLRGRIGYTSGPSLFYITGGAAFVHVKNSFDDTNPPFPASSSKKTATGGTMGGGIETMLTGNWSARAEYLYIDVGSQKVSNPSVFDGSIAPFRNRFHVFRYGISYKFAAPDSGAATADAASAGFSWAGFYAGVSAGSGLSQSTATTNEVRGSEDLAGSGLAATVQGGYNFIVFPNWIAGVEGDISYLGIKRSLTVNESSALGVDADWYGTIRGRLGYSTGPALLYLTSGVAFVGVENNFDVSPGSFFSSRSIATGWTVGAGIEAALAKNWSAKSEYLFVNAGSQNPFNPNFVDGGATGHFDNRFHIFRFGLNRKFGG